MRTRPRVFTRRLLVPAIVRVAPAGGLPNRLAVHRWPPLMAGPSARLPTPHDLPLMRLNTGVRVHPCARVPQRSA